MTDRPLLSMCLIAKDEKHNVRRCLDSFWHAVDEVCIADTGSTDGTLEEAVAYAEQRGEPEKLKTVRTSVCNDEDGNIIDFAAARQAADDLATGRFVTWADMDDSVKGMEKLREMAGAAPEDVLAFFCQYLYARDGTGNTISELWRERVVRNDGTKWTGRLHEHKLFRGGTVIKVDPPLAEWVHHRDHEQRSGKRNLRILEGWDRDEPGDPRIISSLALEYMGESRYADAAEHFAKYLTCEGEPPDRRAQASRHLSVMLMMQGRVQEARNVALASLSETWLWADTHLTMAEAEQTLGHPEVALVHARTAMDIGKPDTLLIINPLQYTAHPRALMAVCLAQMGRFEDATRMAEECLEIAPTYQLAADHVPLWRGQMRKQHALAAFIACTELLVETGELVKARALLNQVPWFIADQQRVVDRRIGLARQIQERIAAAQVAVDEDADRFVARHMGQTA